MPRDYEIYLEDILGAIQKIEFYTQKLKFIEFREDSLRIDAVLYNLMIIGEAVKQIPEMYVKNIHLSNGERSQGFGILSPTSILASL